MKHVDHSDFRAANDPDTPEAKLRQLAGADDVLILAALAYNTATPKDVLQELAKLDEPQVKAALRKRGIA